MNEQQLNKNAKLKYKGKLFDGFSIDEPYVTFLGYDCSGWSSIWVDYRGEVKYISIDDIELTK